MKRRTVSVTVAKVVQAAPFEPLTISVVESAEVESDEKVSDVRTKLYESASRGVHKLMKEELTLWKRKAKE